MFQAQVLTQRRIRCYNQSQSYFSFGGRLPAPQTVVPIDVWYSEYTNFAPGP